MIVRISADNFELSEELAKYASNKLNGLGRFVRRRDRPTTLVEAVFSEQRGSSVDVKTCQLTLRLRREEFIAQESTQHLYASLDVATASVEQWLKDFKKRRPGVLRKYLRRGGAA